MTARVLPCGPSALLAEVDAGHDALALARAIDLDRPLGVDEVVPGACTVLVRFDPRLTSAAALGPLLAALSTDRPVIPDPPIVVEIPVVYDGDDLGPVAEMTGLTVAEVIARHAGSVLTSAFCGFAPGFAYLVGLDPVLHVPRRSSPRTRVPAGAVAIAGPYTAVYPSTSPGGWHLLGRTTAPVWDLDARPPALLAPGTSVRFRAVEG